MKFKINEFLFHRFFEFTKVFNPSYNSVLNQDVLLPKMYNIGEGIAKNVVCGGIVWETDLFF